VATTTPSPEPRESRALKEHVGPLGQRTVVTQGFDGLAHGHRFAGQGRLVGLKLRGLDQTQVGIDDIAALQDDDVAGNQKLCLHLLYVSLAPDLRPYRAHLPQGLHGAHRLQLREEADGGIDDDDGQNRETLDHLAECKGHHGRQGQEPDDEAFELIGQNRPGTPALDLPEAVSAIYRAPFLYFGSGKAFSLENGQLRKDISSVLCPGLVDVLSRARHFAESF
jgi:hypothetical protein